MPGSTVRVAIATAIARKASSSSPQHACPDAISIVTHVTALTATQRHSKKRARQETQQAQKQGRRDTQLRQTRHLLPSCGGRRPRPSLPTTNSTTQPMSGAPPPSHGYVNIDPPSPSPSPCSRVRQSNLLFPRQPPRRASLSPSVV